jgi:hypothetical protein
MKFFIAASKDWSGRNPNTIDAIKNGVTVLGHDVVVFLQKEFPPGTDPGVMMRNALDELRDSDGLIVEMSQKAVGVGIEMGAAHVLGKPIIGLRMKGSEESRTMEGILSGRIYEYIGEDDMQRVLTEIQRDMKEIREDYKELSVFGRFLYESQRRDAEKYLTETGLVFGSENEREYALRTIMREGNNVFMFLQMDKQSLGINYVGIAEEGKHMLVDAQAVDVKLFREQQEIEGRLPEGQTGQLREKSASIIADIWSNIPKERRNELFSPFKDLERVVVPSQIEAK